MSGVKTECYNERCSCFENESRFLYNGKILGFLAGDYFIRGSSCDCIILREENEETIAILVELKDISRTGPRGLEELFNEGDKLALKFSNCENFIKEFLTKTGHTNNRSLKFLVLKLPEDTRRIGHLLRKMKLTLRSVKIVASPANMASPSIP